jgi:hypothetical protein
MGSDEPGDSGIELSLSLAEVFEWFQDSPEQIKRAVILGGKYQSETSRTDHRLAQVGPRLEAEALWLGSQRPLTHLPRARPPSSIPELLA